MSFGFLECHSKPTKPSMKYPLQAGDNLIGYSIIHDIRIKGDNNLSCCVQVSKDGLAVLENKGTEPVYLNEKVLKKGMILKNGHIFTVGGKKFKYISGTVTPKKPTSGRLHGSRSISKNFKFNTASKIPVPRSRVIAGRSSTICGVPKTEPSRRYSQIGRSKTPNFSNIARKSLFLHNEPTTSNKEDPVSVKKSTPRGLKRRRETEGISLNCNKRTKIINEEIDSSLSDDDFDSDVDTDGEESSSTYQSINNMSDTYKAELLQEDGNKSSEGQSEPIFEEKLFQGGISFVDVENENTPSILEDISNIVEIDVDEAPLMAKTPENQETSPTMKQSLASDNDEQSSVKKSAKKTPANKRTSGGDLERSSRRSARKIEESFTISSTNDKKDETFDISAHTKESSGIIDDEAPSEQSLIQTSAKKTPKNKDISSVGLETPLEVSLRKSSRRGGPETPKDERKFVTPSTVNKTFNLDSNEDPETPTNIERISFVSDIETPGGESPKKTPKNKDVDLIVFETPIALSARRSSRKINRQTVSTIDKSTVNCGTPNDVETPGEESLIQRSAKKTPKSKDVSSNELETSLEVSLRKSSRNVCPETPKDQGKFATPSTVNKTFNLDSNEDPETPTNIEKISFVSDIETPGGESSIREPPKKTPKNKDVDLTDLKTPIALSARRSSRKINSQTVSTIDKSTVNCGTPSNVETPSEQSLIQASAKKTPKNKDISSVGLETPLEVSLRKSSRRAGHETPKDEGKFATPSTVNKTLKRKNENYGTPANLDKMSFVSDIQTPGNESSIRKSAKKTSKNKDISVIDLETPLAISTVNYGTPSNVQKISFISEIDTPGEQSLIKKSAKKVPGNKNASYIDLDSTTELSLRRSARKIPATPQGEDTSLSVSKTSKLKNDASINVEDSDTEIIDEQPSINKSAKKTRNNISYVNLGTPIEVSSRRSSRINDATTPQNEKIFKVPSTVGKTPKFQSNLSLVQDGNNETPYKIDGEETVELVSVQNSSRTTVLPDFYTPNETPSQKSARKFTTETPESDFGTPSSIFDSSVDENTSLLLNDDSYETSNASFNDTNTSVEQTSIRRSVRKTPRNNDLFPITLRKSQQKCARKVDVATPNNEFVNTTFDVDKTSTPQNNSIRRSTRKTVLETSQSDEVFKTPSTSIKTPKAKKNPSTASGKKQTPGNRDIPFIDLCTPQETILRRSSRKGYIEITQPDDANIDQSSILEDTSAVRKSARKTPNNQSTPATETSLRKSVRKTSSTVVKTPEKHNESIIDVESDETQPEDIDLESQFQAEEGETADHETSNRRSQRNVQVKSPLNDLSNVSGVKSLFKTIRVYKSPKNDLTDVGGVKKLFMTQKVQKSPLNDLTNVKSIKQIFSTPYVQNSPLNDLTDVKGVKQLFLTPKQQKTPLNDLTDVAGVKKMFITPKDVKSPLNNLTRVSGVKKMFKTPQKSPFNDLTDVTGVKNLFEMQKLPKNDLNLNLSGIEVLMASPVASPQTQKKNEAGTSYQSRVLPNLDLKEDLKLSNKNIEKNNLTDRPTRSNRARKVHKEDRQEDNKESEIISDRLKSKKNAIKPAKEREPIVEEMPVSKRTRGGGRTAVKIEEDKDTTQNVSTDTEVKVGKKPTNTRRRKKYDSLETSSSKRTLRERAPQKEPQKTEENTELPKVKTRGRRVVKIEESSASVDEHQESTVEEKKEEQPSTRKRGAKKADLQENGENVEIKKTRKGRKLQKEEEVTQSPKVRTRGRQAVKLEEVKEKQPEPESKKEEQEEVETKRIRRGKADNKKQVTEEQPEKNKKTTKKRKGQNETKEKKEESPKRRYNTRRQVKE